MNWYSRQESHLQPPRSKRGALIIAPREQKGRRKIAESRHSRVVRTTRERLKDFSIRFLPSKLKWSRRRDSHSRGANARQFTKLLLSLLSHIGKWCVATVLPRALRFKRPLHRCNACNPGGRPRGPRREGGVEPPQPGL